ncbi:type II toxin-antitoxin system VapC family toxin [Caulobacter sp. LjRoot300]|uniref:type II toxin-antitoxin system VapC family toxin n=1 Tax=Caulobacter sp. LjRoot300 TaxID=3342321 RepID=UPI003ECD4554
MMIVDASAVVAILLGEPEEEAFKAALKAAPSKAMSVINFWEVLVRAHGLSGPSGREQAEALIRAFDIEIVGIDVEQTRAAADAFARYGRRTPAALNLGDCFAYALARTRGGALLYKGEDFIRTDIANALPGA